MPNYRLGIAALAALAAGLALALSGSAAAAQGSGCLAHRPAYIEDVIEIRYDAGCTGHDEPELDPLSNAAGSART